MHLTDKDIADIARHGNEEAFRRMFHVYYGKMLSLARYYVHSNELAEEVVNDVFVKIWDQRKKLVTIKKIESYLYVLTKNHALNQIRSVRGQQLMTIDTIDLQVKVHPTDPEAELLSKEMLAVFTESVASLPEKCNLVYRMVKDDGLSYKETAAILDISVKMVEKHVGTALKRIRKDMDNYTEGAGSNMKNILISVALVVASLF